MLYCGLQCSHTCFPRFYISSNKSFHSQLRLYQGGSDTGNLTGLNQHQLGNQSLSSLVSAEVGECGWETQDQEATQQGDDLWTDLVRVKQMWLSRVDWLTQWLEWPGCDALLNPAQPPSTISLDHHDGSNKMRGAGWNQYNFNFHLHKGFFSILQWRKPSRSFPFL